MLQDLARALWIERMLSFETLPALVRHSKSEVLVALFEEHLVETRQHAARVEQAFDALGVETSSNRDAGLDALRRQHDEQAAQAVGDRLADLLHVGAAIRTEHAELALYDALIALAEPLGLDDVRSLLAANRGDEERALRLLEDEAKRLSGELVG